MKQVISFELREEHYRRGFEETAHPDDQVKNFYCKHCAISVAARDAGYEIQVGGDGVYYKRSCYPLSEFTGYFMGAFDNMTRSREGHGIDHLIQLFLPSTLPATIVLVQDGKYRNAVRSEELKEENP